MSWERIYKMPFANLYPAYVTKAEKKGRTQAEVNEIILWLTGHDRASFDKAMADGTDCRTFFEQAPKPNPARSQITGLICGYRVEEIEEPLQREMRYLDKLIDELAKGKKMEKILRA